MRVYISHTNTPAVSLTWDVLLTGLKPTHITSTSLNISYSPLPGHGGQTKSAWFYVQQEETYDLANRVKALGAYHVCSVNCLQKQLPVLLQV